MSAAPIAAVVFDMDGLLLDTERLSRAAYVETCRAFRLDVDEELFLSLVGLNHAAGSARLAEGLAGIADAGLFDRHWQQAFADLLSAGIPVKPGADDLLEGLAGAGIPFAIATSTRTETALRHLAAAGIGRHFDIVVGGDQVPRGKPAPDIYLEAAARLGARPERCAAFEDSENGVRAAMAAGMTTVQIPDLKHPTPDFLRLGHLVAPDLIAGAMLISLPLAGPLAALR